MIIKNCPDRFPRMCLPLGGGRRGMFRFAWVLVVASVALIPRLARSAGSIFDDDWKAPPPVVKPPEPANASPPERQAPRRLPPARPAQPDNPPVKPVTPDAPVRPESRERLKVPADASLPPAEKLVKEVYKAEYARATRPAGQIALARALFNEAQQSRDDPAALYVLLRDARNMAAGGGDAETAVDASRGLRDAFALTHDAAEGMERDALLSAMKALLAASSSLAGSPELRSSVYLTMAMAERDLTAGNYAFAAQAAAQAEQVAKKINDPGFLDRVHSRAGVLSAAAAEYQKIKDSLAALNANPDDPAANLAAGRFYAFVLDRPGQGMPLLAKGSDAALKALAEREIATSSTAADQLALADDWAAAARTSAGAVKEGMVRRALHWYDIAWPQLPRLSRAGVEKRVADLRAGVLKRGLWGEYFRGEAFGLKILTRVDPRIEFNWHGHPPDEDVPGENFTARWTGWIKGGVAGQYKFVVVHDDGVRIWIDGEMVVDKWGGYGHDTQPVSLTGALQEIKIEYTQGTGDSYLGLGWTPPRMAKAAAIPPEALFHQPAPAGPVGPGPVQPDSDGRLSLDSAHANLHGSGSYTQDPQYPEHIGYWHNSAAPITWDFETPEGDYAVKIMYACDGASSGTEYSVSVGNARLTGKVADSGGMGSYRTDPLGNVHLVGGPHKLRIKAIVKPHVSIMGFSQITLTLVK